MSTFYDTASSSSVVETATTTDHTTRDSCVQRRIQRIVLFLSTSRNTKTITPRCQSIQRHHQYKWHQEKQLYRYNCAFRLLIVLFQIVIYVTLYQQQQQHTLYIATAFSTSARHHSKCIKTRRRITQLLVDTTSSNPKASSEAAAARSPEANNHLQQSMVDTNGTYHPQIPQRSSSHAAQQQQQALLSVADTETSTPREMIKHLHGNNVDGIIRWKDVLRSTHPISCDLDDMECLKRQQMILPSDLVAVTNADSRRSLVNNKSTELQQLTLNEKRNLILVILGTILAVGTMIVKSGPGAYRYYIAGAICATASHVIPVPIDTVKTRKQVDPKFAKLSFLAAFVKIWQEEGMNGLLAGLGPTAIGYALEGGIKFGVYEAMKPIVSRGLFHIAMISSYLSFVQSKILAFALCAALSGVAASIVLCPMEALRIRMVANPNSLRDGWFRTAVRMIKAEGMISLIKGMEPMLYKQVPYTITKNVSFDFITRYVYTTLQTTWQMTTIGPITKLIVPFLAAITASMLSCISSQPGDVLLSLVNAQQHDIRRTRDIIRDVLHSEKGWKGFYIGTKARLLHVGIVVTVQLLIYDLVKRICGIAATGITK